MITEYLPFVRTFGEKNINTYETERETDWTKKKRKRFFEVHGLRAPRQTRQVMMRYTDKQKRQRKRKKKKKTR